MNCIWMKVDLKNNEEPLAVADSQRELAKLCGVKESTIRESICRAKKRGWKCRYIKIEDIEEDNE